LLVGNNIGKSLSLVLEFGTRLAASFAAQLAELALTWTSIIEFDVLVLGGGTKKSLLLSLSLRGCVDSNFTDGFTLSLRWCNVNVIHILRSNLKEDCDVLLGLEELFQMVGEFLLLKKGWMIALIRITKIGTSEAFSMARLRKAISCYVRRLFLASPMKLLFERHRSWSKRSSRVLF
jgi:hypothetical protein